MLTDRSTITILLLDVFAFCAVLAYASFESRHKSRKQRRALVKTDADEKHRPEFNQAESLKRQI